MTQRRQPLIAALAEALVAELNRGDWSFPLEAERRYKPPLDLEIKSDCVWVTVVPTGQTGTPEARRLDLWTYTYDLTPRKKLAARPTDPYSDVEPQLDQWLMDVEEIADWFRRAPQRPLAKFPEAWLAEWVHEPLYSPEALDQRREFVSVLTLTFAVRRSK
jgi:hypothetical protein